MLTSGNNCLSVQEDIIFKDSEIMLRVIRNHFPLGDKLFYPFPKPS